MRNYLLRLGWSHGDAEIISTDNAVAWFDLDAVGRAPARFDFAKLDSLNGHYIRDADDRRLAALVADRIDEETGRPMSDDHRARLLQAMPELKLRPKTLSELSENAGFLVATRPLRPNPAAAKLLTREARKLLGELYLRLTRVEWRPEELEECVRAVAAEAGLALGAVAQPLRAALTGAAASPGIFFVMAVLGREETLARISDAAADGG